MNEIYFNTDVPSAKWCKITELSHMLEEQSKVIVEKYRNKILFDIWVTFRCLPKELKRKSIRRYWREDNAIGLDISLVEEEFRPFIDGKYYPLSLVEQKKLLGEIYYLYLEESLNKYKKKFDELKSHGDDFLKDYYNLLIDYQWIIQSEESRD